jgi:hypothetical protein
MGAVEELLVPSLGCSALDAERELNVGDSNDLRGSHPTS